MAKSWKIFRENIDAMGFFGIMFFAKFRLDDDPTESDPDETPSRDRRLVNAFKKPVSNLYALFGQSVIPQAFYKLRNH